jgi:hypothetical protein
LRRFSRHVALGKNFLSFLAFLSLTGGAAAAQHEGHEPAPRPAAANPDPMAVMEDMEPMDHWMTMLHGYAFLNVNRQGGASGDRDFESQNHLMLMATRRWAGGKLSLYGTFSLEPATVPPGGSPELFQRGETYHGVLLVDRQHPHDLFVQLGAAWEKAIPSGLKIRFYLAPVGEPALGPVAYPHRLSASENPTAPLAHHNQDSTHIAADVLTLGLSLQLVTLEASGFHGQEPDENRWNIDQGRLDSYSGRLTVRPLAGLSFQISSGHLEHPEAVEAGNQTRTTASAAYEHATPSGFVAATLITGKNQTENGPEWGSTLEWTWKFEDRNFLYGRVERADRDLYELMHKRQRPANVPPSRTRVEAGTLGYVRNFDFLAPAETGLGADLTLYRFSSGLDPVYGSHPVSFHVFLRIRFGTRGMSHGASMEHMHDGM